MNKFIVPIIGFALLVVLLAFGLNRDPTYVPSPLIGKPVPSFNLPKLGEPSGVVTDADLRGHYSIVNVWGTWCVGCRQEHPVLNQIAARGEVPIFGLNWKDNEQYALGWLEQLGNPYTATAVDADGRVAIDWGVYGAPETFLISPEGIILYRHISPMTMEIWENEFMRRIEQAEGGSS